ncbi:hypothetical protein [Motiliproteus sediminis]|uniref:hypothetical protein n=1 Tax=Motiliproteus sediminis TaxID=1468178 RepID=UPI001AEF424E|nr:hypothetical protein [Motiliproteus sediminis]
MKPLLVLLAMLFVAACSEEDFKPQPRQPVPQPVTPAVTPVEDSAPEPVAPHNLGRVADSRGVTQAQLEALTVGVTTEAEVLQLLGETKPFTLGDGKHILRYDVGKFVFDQNKVLIRKFLNH